MLEAVISEDWPSLALAALACVFALWVGQMVYYTTMHPLRVIPGPWFAAASPLWIAWHRWHGRLSLTADALLTRYGPIVRISPQMVLLNDGPAVNAIFSRRDLATAPTAIRALRVGGHDWTVTYPTHAVAKERRHPVMLATTTKNLKHWRPTFAANTAAMMRDLATAGGSRSEDLVRHLRVCTLRNAQVVLAGPGVELDPAPFPAVVGAYNFLVVWRLCLPSWLFAWLEFGPFRAARFRLRSSARLFRMGAELCAQAARAARARADRKHAAAAPAAAAGVDTDEGDGADEEEPPSVYRLFTDRSLPPMGPRALDWADDAALGAEMAGQVLAATETTSSALTFIVYELVRQPALLERLRAELDALPPSSSAGGGTDNDDDEADRLAALPFLDACIREGLRFRPPVALTGSRVAPAGGLDVLGHHLPAGTVVATQALSMSRQRPDLFPRADAYDPTRWLLLPDAVDAGAEAKTAAESVLRQRRALLVPFGVGARRCPGGNMALDQMRLLLAALVRHFHLALAPETTPAAMAPFEANGYRSRHDACHLIFTPREKVMA